MKNQTQHLAFIDELRGLAIVAVFLFHVFCGAYGNNELEWNGLTRNFHAAVGYLFLCPLSFGKLGVAVFFVISGFCIHLSHAKSKEDTFKRFFLRRFWRIYPPYLFCLLVSIGLARWRTGDFRFMGGAGDFFSHLFLVHNLDKDFSGSINPPFWSIAVEVQLYLVYPLLWLYARRFGWNVALVTTMLVEFTLRGASVVCSLQHPAIEPPQWLVVNPFSFWFTWCLGAALADFYLRKTIPAIGRSQAWALCALALASYFFKPTYFFTFTLVAVATAAWICAHLQSTRAPRPSSRVLRMLSASGLVSYSLYLIHQPILNLATPLTAIVSPHYYHPLLLALVGIALYVPTYYVACAIYRFVELPSIAIGKSFLQRSRAEVQQPVVWPEISESGQGAGAARRRNLRG